MGIAPFFFAPNLEGEPALLFLGSIEISDYLDLLVSPADLDDFLSGLLDFLASTSFAWKTLDLHNLLEHSPLLPALQAEASRRGWDFSLQQTYLAPAIPLRADFETYLAGIDKKQRHEIRRKIRRAEELGGVDWYIVQDASTLEAEAESFFALMASDPAKAAFLTPAMRMQMHLTMQAAFQASWLQLAFLTVDGRKAAGYLNFDDQGRIWVYNSGIDRGFMDYSPGWVLLAHLLRWACEHGRSEFDFMRGTEEYKYRFGGVDQFVFRARLTR